MQAAAFMQKLKQHYTSAQGRDETAYKTIKDTLRRSLQTLRNINHEVRSMAGGEGGREQRERGLQAMRDVLVLLSTPHLAPLAQDLTSLLPEGWQEDWIRLVRGQA